MYRSICRAQSGFAQYLNNKIYFCLNYNQSNNKKYLKKTIATLKTPFPSPLQIWKKMHLLFYDPTPLIYTTKVEIDFLKYHNM